MLLSACVASNNGPITPETRKGFLGKEKDAVSVETAQAFAEKKDVVIGSFKIGFVNYNKSSAKAGGGLLAVASATARTTMRSELEGVPPSTMQAITDAAYKDFIAKLKAQGYNVLDRSVLTSLPAYQKASSEENPVEIDSVAMAMDGDVLYFAPTGQKLHLLIGDSAGIGGGFGYGNPSMAFSKAADENGLAFVSANYIVDFINSDISGGNYARTASVKIQPGLSVSPGSYVNMITGYDGTFSRNNGKVLLGQAIYSTDQYATLGETTSTGMKAANALSAGLGALAGVGTSDNNNYVVNANPVKYQSITAQLIKSTNDQLVSTMAAQR